MNSFYSEEELRAIGFASLGTDVRISRNACFYGAEQMSIGDHVRIDDFCVLSGRIVLGSYIHIAVFCSLVAGDAGIEMADFSGLSSRCGLYAVSDDYSGRCLTNPTVPAEFRRLVARKISIGRHGIVGAGSLLLPGASLGEGASLGAMSMLTKAVPDWQIFFGIPAKPLKGRKNDLLTMEAELLRRQSGD